MTPVTLRLDDETVDELDREADVFGFSNRSDYLRHVIEQRELPAQDIDTAREQLSLLDEKIEYLVDLANVILLHQKGDNDLAQAHLDMMVSEESNATYHTLNRRRKKRAIEFEEQMVDRAGRLPWEDDDDDDEE